MMAIGHRIFEETVEIYNMLLYHEQRRLVLHQNTSSYLVNYLSAEAKSPTDTGASSSHCWQRANHLISSGLIKNSCHGCGGHGVGVEINYAHCCTIFEIVTNVITHRTSHFTDSIVSLQSEVELNIIGLQ